MTERHSGTYRETERGIYRETRRGIHIQRDTIYVMMTKELMGLLLTKWGERERDRQMDIIIIDYYCLYIIAIKTYE